MVDLPVNNTASYDSEYGPYNIGRAQFVGLSSGGYFIGVGSPVSYNTYFVDETTLDPTKVLVLKLMCSLPGFWPALFDATSQQLIALMGVYYTRHPSRQGFTLGWVNVNTWHIETGAVTTQNFTDAQPYELYEAYVNTVVAIVIPVGVVVVVAAIVVPVVVIKKKRGKR